MAQGFDTKESIQSEIRRLTGYITMVCLNSGQNIAFLMPEKKRQQPLMKQLLHLFSTVWQFVYDFVYDFAHVYMSS